MLFEDFKTEVLKKVQKICVKLVTQKLPRSHFRKSPLNNPNQDFSQKNIAIFPTNHFLEKILILWYVNYQNATILVSCDFSQIFRIYIFRAI